MKNETTPEGDKSWGWGGKSEWKELEKRASGCEADKKDVFQDYTVAEMFYFFGFARVKARKKVGKNKNNYSKFSHTRCFFFLSLLYDFYFLKMAEKNKK